ncbi:MAG: hypothetical protein B5M53_12650 [Candidatus Cloacimonas sp. 4484_209]|nr:MAG: hypothetical protein B5M53_12650 [Candidatus Cloacimonas sp. 4484_209]
MHSDINTEERVEIIRNLRFGKTECVVGINLLREGLDLPEVPLVAILHAEKIQKLKEELKKAFEDLDFVKAVEIREKIIDLES